MHDAKNLEEAADGATQVDRRAVGVSRGRAVVALEFRRRDTNTRLNTRSDSQGKISRTEEKRVSAKALPRGHNVRRIPRVDTEHLKEADEAAPVDRRVVGVGVEDANAREELLVARVACVCNEKE